MPTANATTEGTEWDQGHPESRADRPAASTRTREVAAKGKLKDRDAAKVIRHTWWRLQASCTFTKGQKQSLYTREPLLRCSAGQQSQERHGTSARQAHGNTAELRHASCLRKEGQAERTPQPPVRQGKREMSTLRWKGPCPHQAEGPRPPGSQRKPARIRATRLTPAKTHNPGERPWNIDVLHSCKDNNKFMKEKYPQIFPFAFYNVSTKLRAHCTIKFTHNGLYFNKESLKRPPSISSQPVSQGVTHLYLAAYQQWMRLRLYWHPRWVLRTRLLGEAWSWCAPEGPGGLVADTEEAGPLLESAQREARHTCQDEGKHTYKTHPSFRIEWLWLHQSYLQMQFYYLRLMFWNMMSMHSLSPVLPERSWEQKLRHPSLSESSNSLLKTCCRQNLQRLFLIVTWQNNEFLFYL